MHTQILAVLSLVTFIWCANGWSATAQDTLIAHVTIAVKRTKHRIITAEYDWLLFFFAPKKSNLP